MAVIPTQEVDQGVLAPATPLIFTTPVKYQCMVSYVFNNSIAYDITVTMNRVSPPSSIQLYSLTLDPGDTVEAGPYLLLPGDSIEVVSSVAGTVYTLNVTNIPYTLTT